MTGSVRPLMKLNHFAQYWHHSQTNWLPFYWQGFDQTTAYTYILPELNDKPALWNGLQSRIVTEVRQASNRYGLTVRHDLDVNALLVLSRMTFARQALEQPYTDAVVRRVDSACAARGCRKILIGEDQDGRRHAGVYLVWDENTTYYLLEGGDPELRNSGATNLCMWEAINHASTVTRRFDFEGSMVESIERFFRGFGAIQEPYFRVTKTPSRLLRARQAVSSLIRSSR